MLIEEERKVFGVTHEEIGLKSAHAWALPESLRAAIGFHHRPAASPMRPEFVRIIAAGDALSQYWGIGTTKGNNVSAATLYLHELGLSEEDAESLAEQAQNQYNDATRAIG